VALDTCLYVVYWIIGGIDPVAWVREEVTEVYLTSLTTINEFRSIAACCIPVYTAIISDVKFGRDARCAPESADEIALSAPAVMDRRRETVEAG